jgi:hypothetical protein
MPRIFTRKAFKFVNQESGESVTTAPLSFADVPDWATKDRMFGWGVNDEDIEIIESRQDESDAENGKYKRKSKNTADTTQDDVPPVA